MEVLVHNKETHWVYGRKALHTTYREDLGFALIAERVRCRKVHPTVHCSAESQCFAFDGSRQGSQRHASFAVVPIQESDQRKRAGFQIGCESWSRHCANAADPMHISGLQRPAMTQAVKPIRKTDWYQHCLEVGACA